MAFHYSKLQNLALLAVIVVVNASAQTDQQTVLRVQTELVQIDLVVRDAQGKLVRDLKREEFELYEDGKKQAITHFAVGTATRPASWMTAAGSRGSAPAQRVAPEAPSGRYLVLMVDDYHLTPGSLYFVKRALRKFINEQMTAGDQVALVTTSGLIGLFQQFTSRRDILAQGINRLTVQNRDVTDPIGGARITEHQAELIEFGDQDALNLAVNEIMRSEGLQNPTQLTVTGGRRPRGALSSQSAESATSQKAMIENRARSLARSILGQSTNNTRATLSTVESIVRGLGSLPGRKMVVMLSDGFFLAGSSIFTQIYDLRRITDAATRAGVVIYSIDARGLIALPPGGDASEPTQIDPSLFSAKTRIELSTIEAKRHGLNALAADTGGSLYFNTNDLNLGLQKVLDDNETYYVLAYEPIESRRDGRYHSIEVRLPGRPDLKIGTRKGYFEPDSKTPPGQARITPGLATVTSGNKKEKAARGPEAEKEQQLVNALSSIFPLREIPIEVSADFMDFPDGSNTVINMHMDAKGMTFTTKDGKSKTAIQLKAAIFDEKGKTVGVFNELLGLDLEPEKMSETLAMGVSYRQVAKLAPGMHQIRLAIREEGTGYLGSAATWVEIPDLGRKQLTLSGIMVSEPTERMDVGAPSSSASRRFKSGGDLDLLVFAYHAQMENGACDLTIQTQIFHAGKLIYSAPSSRVSYQTGTDPLRLPYAARLSLEGMAPGDYELRLTGIDRIAKTAANRSTYIRVD